MPEVLWYRSLYWRIAFSFVALLAVLLAAQGLVFLWMTGQMTDIFPTRSPAQLASAIASDVGAFVTEQPEGDLRTHVLDTYSSPYRAYVVALEDGRTINSAIVSPAPPLVRAARTRLMIERGERFSDPRGLGRRGGRGDGAPRVEGGAGRGGEDVTGPRGGGSGRGRGGFDGGRRPDGVPGGVEYARVLVDGAVIGMVAVPREAPPMSLVLRALGPALGGVALVLLVTGTAVAALVVFRPTHKRLSELQQAAGAIGAGQLGARAPETGGDEVTALSRAFNEMAGSLQQRTTALETADRTRRQLLADVSHELMTPLAAIRGYVETLQMTDLDLDAATRSRYLNIVNDESERLEQIIGDLLDLARLEGGGGSVKVEDVPVSQLLERVRHRHAPVLADRDVILELRQDEQVDHVRGDRTRLEQALQNLVANAIRHTPQGGRVTVSAGKTGDEIELSVEDTGPGIAPEHLSRIFDRFYKADESRTGTEVPSGSGLGLSIVQAIVSRHGGRVSAGNLESGGARFVIHLPAAGPDPTSIG
jgi:signal transduction histidine kinase